MRRIIARVRDRRRPADRLSFNGLGAIELILLAVLAVQLARLIWTAATPVGAYGDWRGRGGLIPPAAARAALFANFDPFFHTQTAAGPAGSGAAQGMTLFGVRIDVAMGLSSAIIAGPDGVQNSYAVGEEIAPGVILKAVAIDHVVVSSGGRDEQILLVTAADAPADDAQAPAPGGQSDPQQGGTIPVVPTVSVPASIRNEIGLSPRTSGGGVTGIVLSPRGPAFQAAGLQPGDVVTQINGRAITSAGDIAALQNQLTPGARIVLQVERGGSAVPVGLTVQGQ